MAGPRPAVARRAAGSAVDDPRASDERGETLIELMVTVLVIGIAIAGLVGALGASIRFSTSDRVGANSGMVLTSLVETMKTSDYTRCGGAAAPLPTLPSIPGATVYWANAVPSGASIDGAYLVHVDSVRYWNGQTNPVGFQAACPVGGDRGLQEVTLRAWSADLSGGTENISTSVGQQLTFYLRER